MFACIMRYAMKNKFDLEFRQEQAVFDLMRGELHVEKEKCEPICSKILCADCRHLFQNY